MGRMSQTIARRMAEELTGRRVTRRERRLLLERISREVKEELRGPELSKRPIYDGCQVLSPRGELMFRCRHERFAWYLEHTKSELVSTEPPTLRLLFEPTGPGLIGDEYELRPRMNRCVVCGATKYLTRHHVLPRCFRRHYPPPFRRRNQHDVLAMCLHCHDAYEEHALRKKKAIAAALGLPFRTQPMLVDRAQRGAIGAAWALFLHGDRIPPAKREPLLDVIRRAIGKQPLDDEDLARMRAANPYRPNPDYADFGASVVQKVDLQSFLEQWRRHFLETMTPGFMPEGWTVTRSVALDLEERCKPWPWQVARARRAAGAAANAPWWTFLSMEGQDGVLGTSEAPAAGELSEDGRRA